MKIIVRNAKNANHEASALCISEAFQNDFSVLCKDTAVTAKAICSGIITDKFYACI